METEDFAQAIELVNRFQKLQTPQGTVEETQNAEGMSILQQIRTLLSRYETTLPNLRHGLADITMWMEQGLTTDPCASHLADNYQIVDDGCHDAILTITSSVNHTPNQRLELLIFQRAEGEPSKELRRLFDSPYLEMIRLSQASSGFGSASNCVVLFTETLAGQHSHADTFAIFLTSKNALRAHLVTQPLAQWLIHPDSFGRLQEATLQELELAVTCKTVLHEWFHRQGPLPLQYFHHILGNVVTGAFEEARVETGGALKLFELGQTGCRFAGNYELAAMFIIADRVLRYPCVELPNSNSDALSGQYILSQLIHKNAARFDAGRLQFGSSSDFVKALAQIQSEMQLIGNRALLSDQEGAIQCIESHIFEYVPTRDAEGIVHRSVFHEWANTNSSAITSRTMSGAGTN